MLYFVLRAISSAGERCLHTAEVAGSKPASPTLCNPPPFLAEADKLPGLCIFDVPSCPTGSAPICIIE